MKYIVGTIDTGTPAGEKVTIEYNDETKYYTISSDWKKEKIILTEVEMDKLFESLDKIENYRL